MFDHLTQSNNSTKQHSKDKNIASIEVDKNINFLPKTAKHSYKKNKKTINLIKKELHYPKKNIKSKTPEQTFLIKLGHLFNRKNKKLKSKKNIKAQLQAEKKILKTKVVPTINKSDESLHKIDNNQPISKNNIASYSTFKAIQSDKHQKNLIDDKNKELLSSTSVSTANNNNSVTPADSPVKITHPSIVTPNKFHNNILHQVHQQDESADEDALEVNLLPIKKRHFSASQILLSYFMITVICLIISITPYIYFYTQNKVLNSNIVLYEAQINSVNNKNKELTTEVALMKPFSIKLQNLLPLLENHIYWSNFFQILENYTMSNIYYVSLNMSDVTSISLTGKSLSLRDLAEQLVVLQQDPLFVDVTLDNFNFVEPELPNDPKIEFSLSYILSPEIIKNNKTDK